MPKFTEEDFDDLDRDALNRGLHLTLNDRDRGTVEQIRDFLREKHDDLDHGWWYAASHAAYHQQTRALNLSPWEFPPCWINPDEIDDIIANGDGTSNNFNAAKLAKRMIAAGVSLYDPSPIEAIAAAKRRSTR